MATQELAEHGHTNYVKIWGILVVLLIVSVLGPMLGNVYLTLITAFGIAIIKALLVCGQFMHLNVEKRYIWYMLLTMLMLLGVFVAGSAPDVLKQEGVNWEKAPTSFSTQPAPHH